VGRAFTRRALLRLKSFESLLCSLAVSRWALKETDERERPFIVAEPMAWPEQANSKRAVAKITNVTKRDP
jgi:hypothetical protein